MALPLSPPILPMLAKRVDELPKEEGWGFEPKWDGFRALVFRDDREVLIQSRDSKSLNRYFPELVEALGAELPQDCILDGEVVIARNGALDFEALQQRIHPAASRVAMLARTTPAAVVFFDLLAFDGRDLRGVPFAERRHQLERVLAGARPPLHITPATRERTIAADWYRRFEGAGLDGVVAKRLNGVYQPDKRVMLKVKHERDCDCVVAGFRWHKQGPKSAVGSLLLGLYDDAKVLHHVGVCANFTMPVRRQLVERLAPYREGAFDHHPWRDWAEQGSVSGTVALMPGGLSRWSQGKDLSWEPLRPELVVEVAYEHMQGARFRHTAQLRRWRTDKPPEACTYAQLEVVPPHEIALIFGGG